MFEIGDYVSFMWGKEQKFGKIVGYEYDEGNVWEVTVTESMNAYFSDDQLAPATDAYGHPWSSQEKEWNKTEDILQDRYPLQGG